MKHESSLVLTWIAFKQEMKQRRSFNFGFGDLVVQPLATSKYVARLERIHSLLLDSHMRHRRLLPLEMYLEEEIPLVIYHRRVCSVFVLDDLEVLLTSVAWGYRGHDMN